MRLLILLLLFISLRSEAAEGLRRWKFDASAQPFAYTHSQRGSLGNAEGAQLVWQSLHTGLHYYQGPLRFELAAEFSSFPLELEGRRGQFNFFNLSAITYYRNFLLLYESVRTPYLAESSGLRFETLDSHWLGLGYRNQLHTPHLRYGVMLERMLGARLSGFDLDESSGTRLRLWLEYWFKWKKAGGWRLYTRPFYTYSRYDFEVRENQGQSLRTQQLGLRFGVGRLF
jgi:hypothetical protein